MQRSAELAGLAHDLAFLQRDHGSDDFDLRLWARAYANQFLKDPVVLRAAIGITGTILRHCANINGASADGFGPTHGDGKKMRVAKRHVGDGNFPAAVLGSAEFVFRYRDAGVS